MTFNGSMPGPLMVVHEGDYVEVKLVNPQRDYNIVYSAAVTLWATRYGQRAWLRQLDPEVTGEMEDGVLRIVLDAQVHSPSPISWSPDGRWIAFNNVPGDEHAMMSLLSTETLETDRLLNGANCLEQGQPAFSHGGAYLA